MRKVFLSIFEYACERRELDAQRIRTFLSRNSYQFTDTPETADIIIFISCGIIEKNTRACLERIKYFQQFPGELIIGGCGTAIDKIRVGAIHDGKTFITKDLDRLDELFPGENIPMRTLADANTRFSVLRENIFNNPFLKPVLQIPALSKIFYKIVHWNTARLFGEYSFIHLKAAGFKNEYYVRIADGCFGKCTFCALPPAIGNLKSKAFDICIAEFERCLEQNASHITITAEDTGAYGLDCGRDICNLLDALTDYPGSHAMVISSFNPVWLVRYIDRLIPIIKKMKIKSIVIPLQSASKRLLRLMGRHSDIERIGEAVVRLKEADPQLWISTHILTGFPSETMDEINETIRFFECIPFDEAQVFSYSMKPGTPAAEIMPYITKEDIKARMEYIRNYFRKKRYHYFFHKNDFLYISKFGMR